MALDTNASMQEARHGIHSAPSHPVCAEFDLNASVQQWIYSADSDTSSNYNAAQKVQLPGTGSWFMGGSEFSQWKAHSGLVLWLEGSRTSSNIVTAVIHVLSLCLTAGSGKTVLSCIFSLLAFAAQYSVLLCLARLLSRKSSDSFPFARENSNYISLLC